MRIRKEAQLHIGDVLRNLDPRDFDGRTEKHDPNVDVEVTGVYPHLIVGVVRQKIGRGGEPYDETVTITNVQLVRMGIYKWYDTTDEYFWCPERKDFDVEEYNRRREVSRR